ncbi:MAG: hypothetical protein WA726_03505 [Acidimicrobiia bacterium]
MRTAFQLFVLGLALVACGAGAGSTESSITTTTPESTVTRPTVSSIPAQRVPESGETVTGEVPEPFLDAVLADAASRSGVSAARLEVNSAEQVTWNDGSLGCPEPGVSYTQALVDGFRVEVRADTTYYDYRLDETGWFKLCQPSMPARTPPTTTG